MSKVKSILDLLSRGFIPYVGIVPEAFYQKKNCRDPKKAVWFCRPWSEEHKTTRYVCLGCATKTCVAVDPVGWQLMLPISPKVRPGAVVYAIAEPLTAERLLQIRKVLRVSEASLVLNVGRQTVLEWIADGTLDQVTGKPIRVTVESVKRNLEPVT